MVDAGAYQMAEKDKTVSYSIPMEWKEEDRDRFSRITRFHPGSPDYPSTTTYFSKQVPQDEWALDFGRRAFPDCDNVRHQINECCNDIIFMNSLMKQREQ